MSNDSPRPRSRWRVAYDLLSGPLLVVVVYLGLRAVFVAMSEDEGLIAPSGVQLGVAAVGVAVLSLRSIAIFGVPAWIAYRLVVVCSRPAVARWRARRPSAPSRRRVRPG